MDRFSHELLAFGAAFVAGAINSVAGGGSFISFPTLIWLGLPSIVANATNTVSIWPGSLGSAWGYRRELTALEPRLLVLVAPSLIGGIGGALLLRLTPAPLFDRLVPFLILGATCLFMAQESVQRWVIRPVGTSGFARGSEGSSNPAGASAKWLAGAACFQLLVGLYGGYFGAGAGILMLAAFGILGLRDIHQMNGLKNILAVSMNGVAGLYFVWQRMVSWPEALVMAAGAVAGGVGGAGFARRIGQRTVRHLVVGIGIGMALLLLFRR
ncbi:MAG: sulfite exporter TauE/SafE family protein [Vicinamibacterales bacterium]